jgi:hypothetical protein
MFMVTSGSPPIIRVTQKRFARYRRHFNDADIRVLDLSIRQRRIARSVDPQRGPHGIACG